MKVLEDSIPDQQVIKIKYFYLKARKEKKGIKEIKEIQVLKDLKDHKVLLDPKAQKAILEVQVLKDLKDHKVLLDPQAQKAILVLQEIPPQQKICLIHFSILKVEINQIIFIILNKQLYMMIYKQQNQKVLSVNLVFLLFGQNIIEHMIKKRY